MFVQSYSDKASLIEAKKKMEEVVMALEDQLFVEDDKMKGLVHKIRRCFLFLKN